MIKSITIRNVATFGEKAQEITTEKEINIIYGANGTGKSTLSNFLAGYSREQYKDCKFNFKGTSGEPEILVYNKQFREQNFAYENNDIPGVYTLGVENNEVNVKIKELTNERHLEETAKEAKDKTLSSKQKELEEIEERLKEKIWSRYKNHERDFEEIFEGYKRKDLMLKKIIEAYKIEPTTRHNLSELRSNYNLIYKNPTQEIKTLLPKFDGEVFARIENSEVWQKVIVGKNDIPVAELIQKLNNSDWVKSGLEYIESNDMMCPFCQQNTLTDALKRELFGFFDEDYNKAIQEISTSIELYESEVKSMNRNYTPILSVSKTQSSSDLVRTLADIQARIYENIKTIRIKSTWPNQKIKLFQTGELSKKANTQIDLCNLEIEAHNQTIVSRKASIHNLHNSFWEYLTQDIEQDIKLYLNDKRNIEKALESLHTKIQQHNQRLREINQRIAEFRNKITNVTKTVDNINSTLGCFGFEGFRLVVTDKEKYKIVRQDNSPANNTLSEGEQTFITFLYYYHLALGESKPDTPPVDRILVIDDPISSLDSSVLFIVSILVKELMKNSVQPDSSIKQIFILTHNIYFHKNVSYKLNNISDNYHFWKIIKANNLSTFIDCESKSPISTAYELLWEEYRQSKISPVPSIIVQNVMRRIIEYYFKLLGNIDYETIFNHFTDANERAVCKSLIGYLNEGSHAVFEPESIDDGHDLKDRYITTFEKIFKETGHINHYNMMMSLPPSTT